MFNQRDLNELNKGKCEALVEFSHLMAKEGGYVDKSGDSIKDYLIPMISTLVGEKLITSENEFDELLYVLQQYCPKFMYDQLNLESAKNGDNIEVMKFFAALVYQFRVVHPVLFAKLCESVSRLNQLQIAHFVSYMDNAIRGSDINWWHILFLAYTDEDINGLGMSICNNAVNTPHKTPSCNTLTGRTIFSSPVYSILDSPSQKDHIIQDYERRLKAERNLVHTLQADYDQSSTKIAELNLEVEALKAKLERANKNAVSMCGDECPNKNAMAVMQIKSNVRENKFQKLNADLIIARQELESTSKTAHDLRLKCMNLEERNNFLTDENERLSKAFKESLELRQEISKLIKEKEELLVQQSTNRDLVHKAKLLGDEVEALKKHNDELFERVIAKESTISNLQNELESAKDEVASVKKQLEKARQTQDLKAANSRLIDENNALKQRYKDTENKFLEVTKEVEELKGELDIKRQVINNLTDQLNRKNTHSTNARSSLEQPNMLDKTLFSGDPSFFTGKPTKSSTPMHSFMASGPSKAKTPTVSAKGETPYDYKERMLRLREENRKNLPHMRVHHGAFEVDAPYSPTATTKFDS